MSLIIKTTGFEEYLDPSGGAYIKALIIGAHGVGKTPSAVSWPKPIIADCERGLMSVASRKVPYARITSTNDMDAFLDLVHRDSMLPPDKRQYQTVVVDTVDSYQRTAIQHRLRMERRDRLSGWEDWGWLDGKMQTFIERVVNLKANVVVNMHYKDERDRDGDDSVLVKKARLKGDIKDSIFQDFDLIGFMETYYEAEEGARVLKRHIRWHPEPLFPMVRDRSNKLPRFTEVTFEEADYQQIFDAITADIDDLPASTTLQTLEVEGDNDPEVPEAGTGSGPVDEPKLPPAKKAVAKKTAAKKATAKKAAAPHEPADPWTDNGTIDEPKTADGTMSPPISNAPTTQQAIDTVKEKLGGEVVDEQLPIEEPPAPEAEPEKPIEVPQSDESVKNDKPLRAVKVCGDQPDVFKGKITATPGCGRELTADNTDRAKASMLTFKTYLCNDCFDHAREVS